MIAADAFERTVASGWGTADTGGSWTLGTSGSYSVGGSEGRFAMGATQTREVRLGIGAADVDITGRVSFSQLPVGGNAFAYVLARANGSNAIRGGIRVAPNGLVYVQLKRALNKVELEHRVGGQQRLPDDPGPGHPVPPAGGG